MSTRWADMLEDEDLPAMGVLVGANSQQPNLVVRAPRVRFNLDLKYLNVVHDHPGDYQHVWNSVERELLSEGFAPLVCTDQDES